MNSVANSGYQSERFGSSGQVPDWRKPLSTSFSSNRDTKDDAYDRMEADSNRSLTPKSAMDEDETTEETQIIQILLPCMTCNRTFSPEALDRHAKVCSKTIVEKNPNRKTFDSSEMRKKNTRIADFIPPPTYDDDPPFLRASRSRSSLRGTSCTTGTRLLSSPKKHSASTSTPTWDRRESESSDVFTYDVNTLSPGTAEVSPTLNFKDILDPSLPSYAKALAPTGECPYCRRSFGVKAYDRHVGFCKELFTRKQYEIQPTPKETEDAFERQELRTKYKPMKGSTSFSSLRSMSPPKDLAGMAMRFLGGLKRSDTSHSFYSQNLKNNFKKSNESLTSSCYGDYNRGGRRQPSPSRSVVTTASGISNFLGKGLGFYGGGNGSKEKRTGSLLPMRVNTSSNIPQQMKSSTDSLPHATNPYSHIQGSGYGQNAIGNNNFSRNSRSHGRASLHKNFFRSKRVEPEGTENTSNQSHSHTNSNSPLTITPMNFFTRKTSTNNGHHNGNQHSQDQHMQHHDGGGERGILKSGSFLSSDPSYDPYEKAARQLEELLKTQPVKPANNGKSRAARRIGLDRAFQSVMGFGGEDEDKNNETTKQNVHPPSPPERNNKTSGPLLGNNGMRSIPFVLDQRTTSSTDSNNDSYWDKIFEKSPRSQAMPSKTKSQSQSADSGFSDKYRAVSNISSADSAFSRSDGADLEFEALESLMSLGDVPSQDVTPKRTFAPSTTSNTTSLSRIFGAETQTKPTSAQQDPPESLYAKDRRMFSSISTDSNGKGARFCHECGLAYPSVLARFCPDCGVKRVFAP